MVPKVGVKREFEAGLRHATTGKCSVKLAVNGSLFSIRELGKDKDKDGLRLSSSVPKIHCHYGY